MNTVTHRQVLHALNIWKQEKLRASCHHFMNTGVNINEVLSLHSGIVLRPAVVLHHAKQNNWKHDCKPETIDLTEISRMERSKKGEKWKNNDNITHRDHPTVWAAYLYQYIFTVQFLQDISHLKLNDSPATQHGSFLVSQYWQKLNAKNTTQFISNLLSVSWSKTSKHLLCSSSFFYCERAPECQPALSKCYTSALLP